MAHFQGLILAGSHVFVIWLRVTMVLFNTCNDHGGYHFPLLPSPEFHYFHHQSFNNCFGSLGVLDYLHGTDRQFRKSAAFERHFVSFSLVPLTGRHPSEKAS